VRLLLSHPGILVNAVNTDAVSLALGSFSLLQLAISSLRYITELCVFLVLLLQHAGRFARRTALQVARDEHHTEVVALLEAHPGIVLG
jgi:hypothetical protein